MFHKTFDNIITYSKVGIKQGEPVDPDTHEQIEYIIITKRWRNAITNAESDTHANIDSDHYPVKATMQVRLNKEMNVTNCKRERYESCNKEQREALNTEIIQLINGREGEINYDNLKDILNTAKETHMPQINAKGGKIGISEATMNLINEREQQIMYEQSDEAKLTYKENTTK